jgi:hypothetical protein
MRSSKVEARLAVLGNKLARRLAGLPRSPRELNRSLHALGTLRAMGWQPSIRMGRPVGPLGEPIPWITYPALAWLNKRIRPSDQVFEFGSGHSTLWFAARVASVVAVEDNPDWATYVRSHVPATATVLSPGQPSSATGDGADEYATMIDRFPPETFDIILIDGRDRNECVRRAVGRVKDTGIVILDNSERPGNADGIRTLEEAGFMKIDFVGFVAGYAQLSCSSVFLKNAQRWLMDQLVTDLSLYSG